MKTIITVEARMGSTRLPGKMLKPICGIPVLEHVVRRLRNTKLADAVVVATTTNPHDCAIEELCKKIKCPCFRGSEPDITERLIQTAKNFGADVIVQSWGDCPLHDAAVVDYGIEVFRNSKVDFVSNRLIKSYPAGLDVQIFPLAVLERAAACSSDPAYREHGTAYIYTHPKEFTMKNFKAPDFYCPEKRWTYDYEEDFKFISAIYERLFTEKPNFNTYDILALLKREPELEAINSKYRIELKEYEHYETFPTNR